MIMVNNYVPIYLSIFSPSVYQKHINFLFGLKMLWLCLAVPSHEFLEILVLYWTHVNLKPHLQIIIKNNTTLIGYHLKTLNTGDKATSIRTFSS